jgi:hypothetical protein
LCSLGAIGASLHKPLVVFALMSAARRAPRPRRTLTHLSAAHMCYRPWHFEHQHFLGRAAIPHQLRAPRQVRSFVVALTRAVAAGVAAGVAVATSRCVGAAGVTGVVTGNVAAGVAAGGAAGVATLKAALVAVTIAAGIAPEGPKAAALAAVNVAAGGAAIPLTETQQFPPVAGGVARAVAGFVTVRVARAPVQLPPIACVVGSVRDRRLVRREGRGLVVPREPPAIDCGERHREVDKHRNSWSFHRPVEGLMTKL